MKQSLLLTLVFAAALYAVPLYPCPVVARPAMLDEIAQPADVGSVEVSPEFAMPLGDIAPLNNSDWEEKLPMSRDAFRFVATQCPGNGGSNFYIAGGVANSGAGNYRSYETWRYSHYSGMGTWTRLADIPKAVEGAAATCYKGKIYVAGGLVGAPGAPTRYFQIYNVLMDSWKYGPDLPKKTWGGGLAAYGNKIIYFGGEIYSSGAYSPSKSVYRWKSGWSKWRKVKTRMPRYSTLGAWTQRGRYVYGWGGWNKNSPEDNSRATLRLNLKNYKWTLGPNFDYGLADMAGSSTSNYLWSLGGDEPGTGWWNSSDKVVRYDLRNWPGGSWIPGAYNLPSRRQAFRGGFCTTRSDGSGELWAVGGNQDSITPLRGVSYSMVDRCSRFAYNGSFEEGNGLADGWSTSNFGMGDGRSMDFSRWGSYSMRIQGSAGNKTLWQEINTGGPAGDRIGIYGWNRNIGTGKNRGPIRLRLRFYYTDATEETFNLNFKRGEHDWQYKWGEYKAGKPWSSLRIEAQVKDQKGDAYFDGFGGERAW